jgi:gliding motility-associated-like protein
VDGINCEAGWDLVITEPDTIFVAPVLHEINGWEISCFDGTDGSINLNTGGGVSPYLWSWTSIDISGFADTTENLDSLTKGTYTVTVTDNNNCQAVWEYILEQPEKLVTAIDTSTISCFRSNDGAADLSVVGGWKPYSFTWSNGENTEDVMSLDTGWYIVDIIDANNCVIRDSAHIGEPPEINIDLSIPLQYNGRMISCFGESDAIINSIVTGGKKENAYQYEWRPNNEQSTGLSNVPAGIYHLSITDINHCVKVDSIEVLQPLKMVAEVYETNPKCFGFEDGEITLIVQGGTPVYSIVWNNGQVGQTADSIGVGRHDVLITDLNSCYIDTFGMLDQPQLIEFTKDTLNPTCPDVFDGYLHYNIQGGTAPYDLRLNDLRVDEIIEDLGEGTYKLIITDNNQCTLADSTTLKGVSPICVTVPNAFSPNGDGDNDTWIIHEIEIYPDVKIEIYNRWGELIYYAPKGYSKPWDGTFRGRELPIDSYYYVIDLNNGRDVLSGNITIIR